MFHTPLKQAQKFRQESSNPFTLKKKKKKKKKWRIKEYLHKHRTNFTHSGIWQSNLPINLCQVRNEVTTIATLSSNNIVSNDNNLSLLNYLNALVISKYPRFTQISTVWIKMDSRGPPRISEPAELCQWGQGKHFVL